MALAGRHKKMSVSGSGSDAQLRNQGDLRENTAFKSHIRCVGTLFWLLEPKKKKMAQAWILFSVCVLFKHFISFPSSKLVFALSSSSSPLLAAVAGLSFRRELLLQAESSSKSDLWLCYLGKVPFSPSSVALACWCKSFMGFSAGCNSRFQSSS